MLDTQAVATATHRTAPTTPIEAMTAAQREAFACTCQFMTHEEATQYLADKALIEQHMHRSPLPACQGDCSQSRRACTCRPTEQQTRHVIPYLAGAIVLLICAALMAFWPVDASDLTSTSITAWSTK